MGQPLFSLLVTAGKTIWQNQTHFVPTKNYIRIPSIRFISAIEVYIAEQSWDRVFLEGWLNAEDGAAQPLWSFPVYCARAAATDLREKNPTNRFLLFQPIEAGQIDLQFRQAGAYSNGTVFKPTTFSLWVEHYPYTISSG